MGFIKPRTIPGGRSFSSNVQKTKQAAQRASYKVVEGQYNSFYPNAEKALWWALCPEQSWDFEQYNRETGEVEAVKDSFYFGYVNHRVQMNKNNFCCSAGAHKDQPCWGCGVRASFYDKQRAIEDSTGVRPKGEAPISGMPQYAMAGVLLETIAKVELKDKDGKPRLTKKLEKIIKEMPTRMLPPAEAKKLKAEGATTFGLRTHYSTGIRHLNTLSGFDKEMANYCGNCAAAMTAPEFACPECATTQPFADEAGDAVSGQDLMEMRTADLSCDSCKYTGPMEPVLQCDNPECSKPVEGRLMDFALRLISEKVDETSRVLKYTEVRTIKSFIDKYPAVQEMLSTPLPISEIFAPTPVEMQRWRVPEALRGDGVSPAPRTRKDNGEAPAEAYPLGTAGGTEPDADDDDD
jgi:hypothetical protein